MWDDDKKKKKKEPKEDYGVFDKKSDIVLKPVENGVLIESHINE